MLYTNFSWGLLGMGAFISFIIIVRTMEAVIKRQPTTSDSEQITIYRIPDA
jgi:hypothetical protein